MAATVKSKAFFVILQTWQRSKTYLDESLDEINELAASANVECSGFSQSKLRNPSSSHFLREGKLTEIQEEAKKKGANFLLFNVELTPAQARNIEKFTKLPVVDRTGLILEIFGRRAKTKEGQLQVELARLVYALPRVGGLGVVMSRIGGGTRGTRGPGETELEKDTRKIRKRIQMAKEQLEKVRQHRKLIRDGRKKRNFLTVALVGYTNAGKSTLLNTLTGADVYVKDQLFATLDPTARTQTINGRKDILFVDTVGFIRELPHTLVTSFRATLEEVTEADLLIHVLDVSNENTRDYKMAVEEVLKEIKAEENRCILVLNKADLLTDEDQRKIQSEWPQGILLSAKHGLGLNTLLAHIDESLPKPYQDSKNFDFSEIKDEFYEPIKED